MGQKVIPIGIRLGINRTWNSKWYAEKRIYADQLEQDLRIQQHIKTSLKHAGISLVEVERSAQKMKVTIHSSRPALSSGGAARRPTPSRTSCNGAPAARSA